MNMKLMTLGALVALVALAPAATAYHIVGGENCVAPVGPLVNPVPVVGLDLCGDPLNYASSLSLTYGPCPPLVPFPGLLVPPVAVGPFNPGDILEIFPIGCGDILFGLIICEQNGFLESLIGGIIPGTPPAITGDFSISGNGGICSASAGHTPDTVTGGCEFDATVDDGRSNGAYPNYGNLATASTTTSASVWGAAAGACSPDDVPTGGDGLRDPIPAAKVAANWVRFSLTDALGAVTASGGQALGLDCLDVALNLVSADNYYLNEQDLYIRDPHVGLFSSGSASGSYEVAEVDSAVVGAANDCNQGPESFRYD